MALARLISRGQSGLDAFEVSVEIHIGGGLPGFTITGLPTAAVRESKDRVRAALSNCGFRTPAGRVTIHLGPADVPKDGGRFDLAIAVGIVKAARHANWNTTQLELIGELSLSGELKPITGAVPAALAAASAHRPLILPARNAAEAAIVPGAELLAAAHLRQVLDHMEGRGALPKVSPTPAASTAPDGPDLDEVKGHAVPKRAATIAAGGGHHLLLIGPPGSGKSMLAQRFGSLLPPLDRDERLSVASIASVAGDTMTGAVAGRRPFRAPHHTTSAHALVGGGTRPRPGEVSLAHLGVLFLDELPEFSRQSLEALREPLETGIVEISRVHGHVNFPARFQLIAAMNPCPCGFHGDGSNRCHCPNHRIDTYRARISGPLLDRFDLHVEVPQVLFEELDERQARPSAHELRCAVARARKRQLKERGMLNSQIDPERLRLAIELDRSARRVLIAAQRRWSLSTRSVVRVIRVARTIADLDDAAHPSADHVAEALQLRSLDRPRVDTL